MARKKPTDPRGGRESSESQETGRGHAGSQQSQTQQQSQHQAGYQSGGRGRGSLRGGRGGGNGNGNGIPPQQNYGGPHEFQQGRGAHHHQQGGRQAQPRGGCGPGAPAGGLYRQPTPELHQATHVPQQPAVTTQAVPYSRSGQTSIGWSRPPNVVPQQHVQSSNQSDVTIQPVSYGSPAETFAKAGTSSQSPQPTPSDVTKQIQQLAIQPEAAPGEGMQPLSSKSLRFPARPGKGSYGTKCIVKANHFFVQLPDKDLHQYDVTITPEVSSRGVNRAVMGRLVKLYRESHLSGANTLIETTPTLQTFTKRPST